MAYKTEAREKILSFLSNNRDKSFTAKELLLKLENEGGKKSTIFRQLSSLSENGEIKRMTSDIGREVRYQYLGTKLCAEHLHLKCKGCGVLLHLDNELSRLFGDKLMENKGFSLDSKSLIMGICGKCRTEGRIK